ncbi:hypothetical protein [Leucobacter luti]|uniref:hypothetical protein n=1 Tax=Leucobacter luti TaxID=340320 RepID=UPI003CFD4646
MMHTTGDGKHRDDANTGDALTDDPSVVETQSTEAGPHEESEKKDVVSDPARADQLGTDWTDEGGATGGGPATQSEAE